MFSINEDFVKAQYDYTRERLGSGPVRELDERPRRHRAGLLTQMFARRRLRPSLPDC